MLDLFLRRILASQSVLAICIITVTSSVCMAAEQVGSAGHVGNRILTAEEVVEMLAPAKTRSLKRKEISMNIQFEYDSAELTPDALAQLKPVGEALHSSKLLTLSFDIEGHTDSTGSNAYNDSLSMSRAQSVKNYFKNQHGIDASRLSVVGKGENELLDPNNPTSGINRRVTVRTIVE